MKNKAFRRGMGIIIASLLYAASGSLYADGSIKAGRDKARACQVCHGKGGHSTNPTYPRLAGQHAKYIIKQLKSFKAGTRKDPIMNGIAATMEDTDMQDVAAYFESNN